MQGIVMKGIGGFYYVADDSGRVHELRAQAKIRRERIKPAVGDRVEFEPGQGEEDGWLKQILPRRNHLVRPPVANVDTLVVVVACASPEPDLFMADRLIMIAEQTGIDVIVAVNKSDLDPENARNIENQYRMAGYPVVYVSARNGTGVDELRARLVGKIHALAGQSGAGKSTLINALHGLTMQTGSISQKIERGKHTTRHVELVPVEGGGMVLDTPGFSLLEMDMLEPEKLQELYPEFRPYKGLCRFSPCYHASEPDCAVHQALEEGKISRERYDRYIVLLDEMKQRWRDRYH